MSPNLLKDRAKVLTVIEDGRTARDLLMELSRDRRMISSQDLDDLQALALADTCRPAPGKRHLLTVLPRLEVCDETQCSLMKVLALGVGAGLMRYPLAVALRAALACSLRELDCGLLIFAHEPLSLPCFNNPGAQRLLAFGLTTGPAGGKVPFLTRVKRGRSFPANFSIAFGSPIGI